MEKSISFKLSQNDYTKSMLSKFLNKKYFFIIYFLFLIAQSSLIIKNFSLSYIIVILFMTFLMTIVFFIVFYIFFIFYCSYIFKRDSILNSEVTINFNNQFLEEITSCSTIKIKYQEIYELKLLKSQLLIYISPSRIIIIPNREDYDIKKLYLELKNISENSFA